MTLRVEFFALARDLAGASALTVTIPSGGTSSTLLDTVVKDCPRLQAWKDHLRIAVNCRYVDGQYQLKEGDEVAVIPPVSGG